MGDRHYAVALDADQQQFAREHRALFARMAVEAEPATRGELAALTAEVRALRAELAPRSSLILTGRDVVDVMRQLRAREG